ncbi:hypothetical protein EE612_031689, partial [Oryza sativa]
VNGLLFQLSFASELPWKCLSRI